MAIYLNVSAIMVILVFHHALSIKHFELEQKILEDLFKEYNPNIRPPGGNGTGPVVVDVNTYIRSIYNVDDVTMEYGTQLTFRQTWKDERLRYSNRDLDYITLTRIEKIWTPDLFFSNEKSGQFHDIIVPNTLIRIYPDGKVLYSTRISLTLFCPMDLKNYPLDNQVCSVKCASYAYTTNDIKFVWKQYDPIQMGKISHLSKFTVNRYDTAYCTSKTNTGEYSCLQLNLYFSRDVTFYLERAYMPTMALVLLSWISFWLNPRSTNMRVGIWVGDLIAMIIITTSINDSTPAVSYTKAIDVWLGVCISFVFCVVIELCLVSNAVTSDDVLSLQNQLVIEESLTDKNSMGIVDGKRGQLRSFTSPPLKWLNKYSTRAQRIDAVSRFLFPAAFAFFNLIYWLTYTSKRMD